MPNVPEASALQRTEQDLTGSCLHNIIRAFGLHANATMLKRGHFPATLIYKGERLKERLEASHHDSQCFSKNIKKHKKAYSKTDGKQANIRLLFKAVWWLWQKPKQTAIKCGQRVGSNDREKLLKLNFNLCLLHLGISRFLMRLCVGSSPGMSCPKYPSKMSQGIGGEPFAENMNTSSIIFLNEKSKQIHTAIYCNNLQYLFQNPFILTDPYGTYYKLSR